MKNTIIILLVLLFVSCSSSSEENEKIASLNQAYLYISRECTNNYSILYNDIINKGGRSEDLTILSHMEAILELRENAGIIFNEDYNSLKLDFDGCNKYLDAITDLSKIINAEDEINILSIKTTKSLNNYIESNANIDLLYFLLNLTVIEKTILAKCQHFTFWDVGFELTTTNYIIYSNSDTINVGSEYNMILSPGHDFRSYFWNMEIDSLILSRNGSEIMDSFIFKKNVEGAAYFEFSPKEKGEYTFSGNYTVLDKAGSYKKKERFIKTFIVK